MKLYFFKIIAVYAVSLFLPMVASAQNPEDVNGSFTDFKEENFRARVVEVTDQQEVTDSSGSQTVLQDLTLVLLNGSRKGEQILFKGLTERAMKIGTDHIASMINTLFLAYTSSAFFLMFLIQSKQPPFNNFLETINNEVVATEVVRVLVGSTGLVLAIPITTYIASFYYFKHLK